MSTTQRIWNQNFTNVTGQLEAIGAVAHLDGFAYVNETIAPALASAYRGLVQVGYAEGWI